MQIAFLYKKLEKSVRWKLCAAHSNSTKFLEKLKLSSWWHFDCTELPIDTVGILMKQFCNKLVHKCNSVYKIFSANVLGEITV
jgi:hypothetical protein